MSVCASLGGRLGKVRFTLPLKEKESHTSQDYLDCKCQKLDSNWLKENKQEDVLSHVAEQDPGRAHRAEERKGRTRSSGLGISLLCASLSLLWLSSPQVSAFIEMLALFFVSHETYPVTTGGP